jgi:hypothetical protein
MKRGLIRAMSLLQMTADEASCAKYGKDDLIAAAHNIIAQCLDLAPVLPGEALILQLTDATIALVQRIENDAEVDLACRERVLVLGENYSTRLH